MGSRKMLCVRGYYNHNMYRLLYIYVILLSCKGAQESGIDQYSVIQGLTMGTYYQITTKSDQSVYLQDSIENLLSNLNDALSTYVDASYISKFNQHPQGIGSSVLQNPILATYLFDNLALSREIFEISNGYFDPTVMPLVNYWGFGFDPRIEVNDADSIRIRQMLEYVGFDGVMWSDDRDTIFKKDAKTQLDFSAIAKGYAIDVLCEYLDGKGIGHYLVDIGGEVKAKGVSERGRKWQIGVAEPNENSGVTTYGMIVELGEMAMATSGNYRNYYEVNGNKISHTINPITGFFERNDLLSASILTADCARADALATACMALGYQGARDLVESFEDVDAILIYVDDKQAIRRYVSPQITSNVKIELENGI